MKHSIIDLLIRPGAFFQNAMTDKESLKLSPRDAALCVGIPVVLYILFMVYSITVI